MWVNIDKPLKTMTIHDDKCVHIPSADTLNKELNRLGRDGGWVQFENEALVSIYYESYYSDYALYNCSRCIRK